jgi:glycosyltransferase involved in cell wall biosynthesis
MLEQALVEARRTALKRLWIAAIEKKNLEHAAAIHVTSQREAEELARFGFALPAVREVANGVDLDPAPVAPPSPAVANIINAGPFLLFLGRLNWKKGLDRLIAALAQAPSVRVVVAGNDEGGYRRVLESQAAALGVTQRITFAGGVFGSDKTALMTAADALVLPSYSENFGNVVLEAMAAGRPVIVTPEVGLASVVRRSGAGLVTEGTPAALASAMLKMTSGPSLRREMAERGSKAASDFSWPAIAAQMEALYHSILEKPARS